MTPRLRLVSRVLLGALVVWLVLCLTVFVENTWRHSVDSAIYLLTAQSLALGEGYQYLGQPFFVRPPGLSWLISGLVDAPFHAGQVGDLNLLVQGAYALTMLSLLVILRRLHGALWGTAITLLVALNPLCVDSFNEVLAEYPSMTLLFGGLALLMPRADGTRAKWAPAVAGALLLGASMWFRSVGLLVLPAIVFGEAVAPGSGKARARGLLLAGLTLALALPWMLESGARADAAPRPSTQLLMFDYGTAMFRENPSDPESARIGWDDWVARATTNSADIAGTLARMSLGSASGREGQPRHDVADDREHLDIAPWLAGLFGLALLITAALRRSLFDLWAVAYAGVVLLYFTFVDRLLLPLVPALLSALFFSVELALKRCGDSARHAVPATLAGLLALSALLELPDASTPSEKKLQNFRADRQVARWIGDNLPPDAPLMYEKGSILSLLTGHDVFTYRNLPGPWPLGAAPVDFALFGPRHLDVTVEQAVAKASREAGFEPVLFPVKFWGQQMPVNVYPLAPSDD
ncbi:MAG: hypothetical protein DHS20C15_23140 [Planctomycetota bacterium]|nr:MAG: hypothetical protein DHS20C15_23140 [Planctomycetota bacterium]